MKLGLENSLFNLSQSDRSIHILNITVARTTTGTVNGALH